MPSLKAIRTRIGSIKNTRKITRAMKLVSAAKLRRAQDAIIAARPYTAALGRVVSELSASAGPDAHPLFETREPKSVAFVVVTSDRGLAGAFNSNIIKAVERFVANDLASATHIYLRLIGKKANQHFTRRNAQIWSFDTAPTGATALELSQTMSARVIDDFTTGKVDRVYVVYNEFKSAISQNVQVSQILPVVAPKIATVTSTAIVHGQAPASGGDTETDFIYEPSKQDLLTRLVPLYLQIGLYRANLESIASEFGARMSAMDSATTNAGDMIARLSLQYNRARQASITKELLEIIGGAEALKG
jgi:F-type H+-transporting ATPase subunit gamma